MRVNLEKAAMASRLAITHPTELVDRLISVWEASRERGGTNHSGSAWQEFVDELTTALGPAVASALKDPVIMDLEREVAARMTAADKTPFTTLHNADLLFARACYAICRSLRPEYVVETGVAYGVTTSYLLAALEANGGGVLHSIDLPPLAPAADNYVGLLIPVRLRGRWRLHRGATRRLLPKLLSAIHPIDMFVHDSLHTYPSVSRELELVTPYLAAPGAVVVDDVDSNRAFSEWINSAAPRFSAVVQESRTDHSQFGVAVF
jgi:predicted O-methyltransferase YrrM